MITARVALEVRVHSDGSEHVYLLGVFGEDDEMPPQRPGAIAYNVVRVFAGLPASIPVFQITPPKSENALKERLLEELGFRYDIQHLCYVNPVLQQCAKP